MKDSAWYNRLWQNKMQQLTLIEDGDAAWKNMQALLDKNMPVAKPAVNPTPARPWWVKLLAVLAVVTTIAVIYYAGSRMLAHHPKKTIKQIGKHALINRDSAENKGTADKALSANNQGNTITASATSANSDNKTNTKQGNANIADAIPVSSNDKANNKQAPNNNQAAANQPSTTGAKLLSSNTAAYLNKPNSKQGSNNTSAINVKAAGINHSPTGNGHVNQGNTSRSLGSRKKNNSLLAANGGSYAVYAQNGKLHTNAAAGNTHTKTNNNDKIGHQNGGQNLANVNTSSSTNTSPANTENRSINTLQNNTPQGPLAKTNNTNVPKTTATTASVVDSKSKTSNAGVKLKASNAGKGGNSNFDLGVRFGINTNGGGPSIGISTNYHISKKWGLAFGADVLAARQVSGSYSKDSLVYVTTNDTGKQIRHNSGKLIINGSRKIYTIDIPVMASYKPSDRVTIMAGGIISIPLKTGTNKNTLGALSSSADSTTVKEATPYVNSTTINNKLSFSLSAGVRYSVKRVFIDAGYVQGISPYTVSSSLGSSKINYRTVQFGIGYQLFKATNKK